MSKKLRDHRGENANALAGTQLDMAVAQAVRFSPQLREDIAYVNGIRFAPSRDWADGGPLIERFRMRIQVLETPWTGRQTLWSAEFPAFGFEQQGFAHGWSTGPTPLVAAMRALVDARNTYREAERGGGGWADTDGRDALALVVELVRIAGARQALELKDVQALAKAAEDAGVPLGYRFRRGVGDRARSAALSDDLAHLASLGVIRLQHASDGSAVRYQAGSEAADYLKRFRTLLSEHAAGLHAAVRSTLG